MSAWGVGSFDNQIGTDFAQEVLEDGPVALNEALQVALDPDNDYLEAEEGHRALAAAEILAAILSGHTGLLPEELQEWVPTRNAREFRDLRDLALDAVERVLGPHSELPEIWEETADLDAWIADVQRLKAALN